jgi:hypothetical protein
MLDFKPQKPNVKKRKFNIGTNPSKKTNLVEVEQIITTKITNNPVNQPVDDDIPDERTENPNKPKRFVIGSNSNNSNNNTNNKKFNIGSNTKNNNTNSNNKNVINNPFNRPTPLLEDVINPNNNNVGPLPPFMMPEEKNSHNNIIEDDFLIAEESTSNVRHGPIPVMHIKHKEITIKEINQPELSAKIGVEPKKKVIHIQQINKRNEDAELF